MSQTFYLPRSHDKTAPPKAEWPDDGKAWQPMANAPHDRVILARESADSLFKRERRVEYRSEIPNHRARWVPVDRIGGPMLPLEFTEWTEAT